jgi:predicted transcriptional regulator
VKTVSFRIDQQNVAALDAIATNMDRDRSYLLNEAVESYLHQHAQFAATVEEGLKASQEGRLMDHEDVVRLMDSWEHGKSAETMPDKEAIGSL